MIPIIQSGHDRHLPTLNTSKSAAKGDPSALTSDHLSSLKQRERVNFTPSWNCIFQGKDSSACSVGAGSIVREHLVVCRTPYWSGPEVFLRTFSRRRQGSVNRSCTCAHDTSSPRSFSCPALPLSSWHGRMLYKKAVCPRRPSA